MGKRTPDHDWLANQARLFLTIYQSVVAFVVFFGIGAAFIFAGEAQNLSWPWLLDLCIAALISIAGGLQSWRS